MKKSKKVVSLLLSASMMAALISGCGSSSEEGSTGSTTTPKAQKKDIGANGVPGVDDAALADMLVEAASDPLYSEICVSDPTCTNGILPPMYDSRADIDKAIPEDAGSYTADEIKIGYQIYMYDNDWFTEIAEGAKAAAEDYGVELVIVSAEGSDEGCLRAVENLITQGCQGVLLNAVSLDVNNKLANMCAEAGIMSVGAGIMVGEETGVLTSCTTNNFGSAKASGQVLAEKLSGEHIKAACSLSYWGETNAESRMAGFTAGVFSYRNEENNMGYTEVECETKAVQFWQEVRQNGSASSDEFDFEICSVGESNNTEEGGQKTAENAFTAHPDINAFFANNDFEGVGVTNGARNMGITLGEGGCWVVSANDGYIKALDMIKDGEYLTTCDGGSYANGYAAVALLCEILLNGYDANDLTPLTCSAYEPIDESNMDKYYIEGAVLSRGTPSEPQTISEYNKAQAEALSTETASE